MGSLKTYDRTSAVHSFGDPRNYNCIIIIPDNNSKTQYPGQYVPLEARTTGISQYVYNMGETVKHYGSLL